MEDKQPQTWRDGIKASIEIIEEYLKASSMDIFNSPPPGEHGETVDACSAAALRAVLPNIITDLNALL